MATIYNQWEPLQPVVPLVQTEVSNKKHTSCPYVEEPTIRSNRGSSYIRNIECQKPLVTISRAVIHMYLAQTSSQVRHSSSSVMGVMLRGSDHHSRPPTSPPLLSACHRKRIKQHEDKYIKKKLRFIAVNDASVHVPYSGLIAAKKKLMARHRVDNDAFADERCVYL